MIVSSIDECLQKVYAINLAFFDIAQTLMHQLVAKAHQHSNTRFIFRLRYRILAQRSLLDEVGKGPESRHEVERYETIVEALDESTNIAPSFNKSKWRTEPDFRNDIVRHVDCPWRKVELFARLCEPRGEFRQPLVDAVIDQWFHLLNVAECVRPSCNLPVVRMDFVLLHIEQALLLAKAASDVVVALVRLATVDFGKLCRVRDEQESGCDAQDRAMVLRSASSTSHSSR